jgi:hypothetical protein
MTKSVQPWLADPAKESTFILAPALVPVLVVILFQDYFLSHQEVSSLWWIILVLCIDVSHVYSTLFRLYWDKPTFIEYQKTLIIIPIVALALGFAIHYYDAMIFWRILAYLAVFHFVRQQYGFLRLYSRKEITTSLNRFIDSLSIYNATLYPLIYWHLHLTGKLSWFVQGDFISIGATSIEWIFNTLFIFIIIVYIFKEGWMSYQNRIFNIPKNMIMLGTYASWYVGIIMFEGDLIFTLLNVVAHGIPYMGLIWIYGEKRTASPFSFTLKGVAIFLAVLFSLAYFEELIWDVFVWKDHISIFPLLTQYSPLNNPLWLSIIVSVLVLPQVTHYVLDGFIWRFSKDKINIG